MLSARVPGFHPSCRGIRAATLAGAFLVLTAFGRAPAAAVEPDRSLAHHAVDSWGWRQGLGAASINAVAQTPDGYLWLGTYDGLVRFDGVRFTSLKQGSTPGLDSNGIRDLAVAPDGSLWLATNGGGVSRCRAGACVRFGAREGLPDPLVWAIDVDHAGVVWAGASTGRLYRRTGGAFVAVDRPGSRPIGAIMATRGGALWIATYGDGLACLDPGGGWTRFTTAEGLPSDVAGSLAEGRGGAVWAATAAGAVRIEGSVVKTFVLGGDGTEGTVPAWSVHSDSHGTVWVGGTGGHLGRVRDGRLELLPRALGLPDGALQTITEDDEGNLWLGSFGYGLWRLRDVSIVNQGRSAGLPTELVHAVAEAEDGSLVVGTSQGVFRLGADGVDTLRATREPVRAIAVARGGALWVALDGGGIGRLRGREWRVFGRRDGIGSEAVRSIVVDQGGVVWAATLHGLSRYDGSAWTNLTDAQGLPGSAILALLSARDGSLWGGTEGAGLFRIHGGRIESFGAEVLRGAVVMALAEGRDGSIWFGTNHGAGRVRDGQVRLLVDVTRASVSQIAETADGDVWTCGADGLVRLGRASLDARLAGGTGVIERQVFGTPDGLGSPQCTAPAQAGIGRGPEGRMHFATYGGVSTVFPGRVVPDVTPPHVSVEETRADGRVFSGDAGTGVRRIEIRYAGICLRTPDKIRFRYQLQGFDPTWVDGGTDRVAQYTNLPPGRYRFVVRAANGSGVWNEEGASADIVIAPFLHEARWFRAAAVVLLAAAVLLLPPLRVRRLRRQKADLERLVAARTTEVQDANARLAQLSREDALTGVANRRRLDEALDDEWSRAVRQGSALGVLLLDVDNFKAYNDHLGHLAGDACLRHVARTVADGHRRAGELVARFGGEEFAVLLPGVTREEAAAAGHGVRERVEALGLPHPDSSVGAVVTVSVGVAWAVPAKEGAPTDLVGAADRALYRAKDGGRNRVEGAAAVPSP